MTNEKVKEMIIKPINGENTFKKSSSPDNCSSFKTTTDFRTIAQVIKDSRKAHGWTQREFAEKLGITQASLCLLEKSDETKSRRPTKRVIRALAPYVDIPLHILVGLADYDYEEFEEKIDSSSSDAEKVMHELQLLSPEDLTIFSGIFNIMRDAKSKTALRNIMVILNTISDGPNNELYAKSVWERDLLLALQNL